jgi:CDP-diacylglycerol---glycerol-3-phosphate 3-phosphatidyltransferase
VTARSRTETVREAPRIRDLPPPRRNESAAGGVVQRIFAWPYRGVLAFLIWTGVRPWQLTVLSLLLTVTTGVLIVTGAWLVAGLVLLLASLCDVFDGSVARQRGEARRSGAFLDSVLDRVSDMVLFSCVFWVLVTNGQRLEGALALATLVVSLGVSQVRAEAEAVGVKLSDGFFQRLERMIAMMAGLMIPHAMLPVLVLLATLGALTVVQRVTVALRGA